MGTSSLMSEGFTLMAAGMGFVFVFLTLLVFATGLMSKLVNKYAPDIIPTPVIRAAAPVAQSVDQNQLTAVIAAAIHQYRARHKK
ncbi:MAG: OadG family transporter subunit [Motiliproteus sp.]